MSNPIEEAPSVNSTDQSLYPFEFRGNGFEYFKIWIVNVLLTILTLYVYSAWAKVRTNRYFYGNTYLDNSSFEYHVKPLQILLSRMIAIILFALVVFGQNINPYIAIVAWALIVILFPWAMWRSLKFNSYMSSYRNIRFGFDGKLGRLYFITLGIPILSLIFIAILGGAASMLGNAIVTLVAVIAGVVLFYCLFPWFKKLTTEYKLNNYRYGQSPFSAALTSGSFFAIYGKAFLLFLLALVVLVLISATAYFATGSQAGELWETLKSTSSDSEENNAEKLALMFQIVSMPLIYGLGFLLFAYVSARVRNYALTRTFIGHNAKLKSTVRARSLAWLILSNLLLVVFTLGLAYPWAKVRSAKFYARNTKLLTRGSLDQYTASEKREDGALGEELGDAFDMDIGI